MYTIICLLALDLVAYATSSRNPRFAVRPTQIPSYIAIGNVERTVHNDPSKCAFQSCQSRSTLFIRGGSEEEEELTLDEKVARAMKKFSAPPQAAETKEEELSLDDKVARAMDKFGLNSSADADTEEQTPAATVVEPTAPAVPERKSNLPPEEEMAQNISSDLNVDINIAYAALAAGNWNDEMARSILQYELDSMKDIPADSPEVTLLKQEGGEGERYGSTFDIRRALALTEGNVDDARAILEAEAEDARLEEEMAREAQEEKARAVEERLAEERLAEERRMKEERRLMEEAEAAKQRELEESKARAEAQMTQGTQIEVSDDFDPLAASKKTQTLPAQRAQPPSINGQEPPPPADRSSVIFSATAETLQKHLLESPVPIILDVYADWCGPCKALTPILEDITIKAGGAFRLLKLNADNDKAACAILQVSALPTLFAIQKGGKIVTKLEGMPNEDSMKQFMMSLMMPSTTVDPKLQDMGEKLQNLAIMSGYTFAQREQIHDRTIRKLDALVKLRGNDLSLAEETASTINKVMNNIIKHPKEVKYQSLNLSNKAMAARIASFPPAISILKSVGFQSSRENSLTLSSVVSNLAPLTTAQKAIQKWIDQNRYEIQKAARARKDDALAKIKLKEIAEAEAEAARIASEAEDESDEEVDIDEHACTLRVRMEGTKKIHILEYRSHQTLAEVIEFMQDQNAPLAEAIVNGEPYQITCASKRLILKSNDDDSIQTKTLGELGLLPSSNLVIKVLVTQSDATDVEPTKSSISERMKAKKKGAGGSHTMQSIGVYSKDDNNKMELIDGGSDVLWEHDVSDDEEKVEDAESETAANDKGDEEGDEEN